jgi:hypothetical protein
MKSYTTADLAQAVRNAVRSRGGKSLAKRTLVQLFELMYYVSLRTEESQPITFHIVYLDPKNPDPCPPKAHCPRQMELCQIR